MLIAARRKGTTHVTMKHFEATADRITGGLETKNNVCHFKFFIRLK